MRILSLCLLFAPVAWAGEKKLIEFGWDEPDTAFVRAHLAEMERTPFDGTVLHVNYLKDGKPTGQFIWECWSKRAFTAAELQPAVDDLKATPFKTFTENFLRFDSSPGDVDWFDDFSAVVSNARLAAHIAKEGGCRGILFDDEMYNTPLFHYAKQIRAKTKSWDEYAKQAHLRGGEVMHAFQEGYPGVTVMLTFGYTLPRAQTNGDATKLRDVSYGLLAPFLDGMVEAAAPDSKIIDGFEMSYAYQTSADFAEGRRVFLRASDPFIANPKAYRSRFTQAFGLWLDDDWRHKGWNVEQPGKNYFTPEKWETSVKLALKNSDKYVWIYTEMPRWWTAAGKPEKLPDVYEKALRAAKESVK